MVPYLKIAEEIEKAIAGGVYTSQLPHINALCTIYKSGPSTIKRALQKLKEQDYIRGIRGSCIEVNPAACNNPYFRKQVVVYAVMRKFGNIFYSNMLQQLGEAFASVGCSLSIVNTLQNLQEVSGKIHAVLMLEPNLHELECVESVCGKEKILLINSDLHEGRSIRSDNYAAGFMAMEYLHGKCKHRKIAILGRSCDVEYSFDLQRVTGAYEYAGQHDDLQITTVKVDSADSVEQQLLQTFGCEPEVSAFFLLRDYFAFGVYNYCARCNLPIPEKIAVLGFDDREFCGLLQPPLSSFQEDGQTIANLVFEKTLQLLRRENEQIGDLSVPPELMLRNSTGLFENQ